MPSTTVVMPKMGYDMTEGKIVRWLKHEGDSVQKGEPIAEIETDKVNIQIEAFASGPLQKILVQEGETVPVGQPIAQIGEPGERPSLELPSQILPRETVGAGEGGNSLPITATAREPQMQPRQAPPARAEEERIKASPVARRLAEERGVELSQIKGSGPSGRITKEDVERFLIEAVRRQAAPERAAARPIAAEKVGPPPTPSEAARPAAPPPPRRPEAPPTAPPLGIPSETRELSRMGQAIARHMADSKQHIPHFYVTAEIDMSRVVALREDLNQDVSQEERISFNDFVMKATALALAGHPKMNASYSDGKLVLYKQINLGMAVAVEDGLIAPVIRECDRKPLAQIARESRELVVRTREGKLRPEDYSDGTFTVSNMGMLGVEEFTAIINPPQSAILAVGTVAPRPVVREGALVVAHTMKATVSADHRVANGADAARFLVEIKRLLENPAKLLL